MIETSDFRKNLKIIVDGEPYVITDFQHVKPGKGNQFTRTKMRSLLTGSNLERTFKSGERFEEPDVMNRDAQYLYKDDNGFHFMVKESYEQVSVSSADVGDAVNYLIENLDTTLLFYNGRVIAVDVPNAVNLKVAATDPGVKGDRVTGGTKPATMETGLVLQIPLHISEGEVLRVDTRTGLYVGRVNS